MTQLLIFVTLNTSMISDAAAPNLTGLEVLSQYFEASLIIAEIEGADDRFLGEEDPFADSQSDWSGVVSVAIEKSGHQVPEHRQVRILF